MEKREKNPRKEKDREIREAAAKEVSEGFVLR